MIRDLIYFVCMDELVEGSLCNSTVRLAFGVLIGLHELSMTFGVDT